MFRSNSQRNAAEHREQVATRAEKKLPRSSVHHRRVQERRNVRRARGLRLRGRNLLRSRGGRAGRSTLADRSQRLLGLLGPHRRKRGGRLRCSGGIRTPQEKKHCRTTLGLHQEEVVSTVNKERLHPQTSQ